MWTVNASAHSPLLVQMFEVAFSRRICCSRVRQRQHEAAPPVGIDGLATQPPRHLADMLLATGEQPQIRPAEVKAVADGLPLGDDDVGPHLAGRPDQPERYYLGNDDDQQRPRRVAGSGERRQIGDATEDVGVLHDDAAGVLVDRRCQRREVARGVASSAHARDDSRRR